MVLFFAIDGELSVLIFVVDIISIFHKLRFLRFILPEDSCVPQQLLCITKVLLNKAIDTINYATCTAIMQLI